MLRGVMEFTGLLDGAYAREASIAYIGATFGIPYGSFLGIRRGRYLYRQQSLFLLAGGCRMVVGTGRPTCNLPGRSRSSPPMR